MKTLLVFLLMLSTLAWSGAERKEIPSTPPKIEETKAGTIVKNETIDVTFPKGWKVSLSLSETERNFFEITATKNEGKIFIMQHKFVAGKFDFDVIKAKQGANVSVTKKGSTEILESHNSKAVESASGMQHLHAWMLKTPHGNYAFVGTSTGKTDEMADEFKKIFESVKFK